MYYRISHPKAGEESESFTARSCQMFLYDPGVCIYLIIYVGTQELLVVVVAACRHRAKLVSRNPSFVSPATATLPPLSPPKTGAFIFQIVGSAWVLGTSCVRLHSLSKGRGAVTRNNPPLTCR